MAFKKKGGGEVIYCYTLLSVGVRSSRSKTVVSSKIEAKRASRSLQFHE